ncbi:MAG: GAF domain-containing protein [Deferrisomatales bacterium]|nr:GAF domain-containing protein [Deferrisomatales bacterium]
MPERSCNLPTIRERLQHPDFPWALECVFSTFNELVDIDHNQSWRKILYDAARVMVEFLGARAASIRLYDPHLNQMVSFGSYHFDEEHRETAIPFEESIAGRVVETHHSQTISDIASSPLYLNKGVVEQGLRSLLAIPLVLPRFLGEDADIHGAIQVYYPEAQRVFDPIETTTAELMAQRVSYVIARKRILDLRRMNEKKEWLVQKIFAKLSMDRGIKMKELFQLMVDELQDIITVQSCTLFAVNEDCTTAVLESGWPEAGGYHTVGKVFRIDDHPYLRAAVLQDHPLGDFANERVYPSYLLVKNPQESYLVTAALRHFAQTHEINSILYVPLRIGERVSYVLVFDALERRRFFADEEVELLTFFGKQITQALEIERLDDTLHDFKNPAIAIAGFARRVRRMVEQGEDRVEEMIRYLDVVIQEGTRLQEMAMSLYPTTRPERLDFSAVVRGRFLINQEAIREQRRVGIEATAEDLEPGLEVSAWQLAFERVLDNLLNNATKAIPSHGGRLRLKTYGRDGMAHLEISNSGRIPGEEVERIVSAEVAGRGLNIVYRFVRSMGGKVDVAVDSAADETTFLVSLPLCTEPPEAA